MPNVITLKIGNNTFTGWEEASVTRTIENLCGGFSFKLFDNWTPAKKEQLFRAQDAVTVSVDKNLVITGYIDSVNTSGSAGGGTAINISGRDRTSDLVDCTAMDKNGRVSAGQFGIDMQIWNKADFEQLVRNLVEGRSGELRFGMPVVFDYDKSKNKKQVMYIFQLQSGETVQAAVSRLCAWQQVVPVTRPSGSLYIVNPGQKRATVNLEYGKNIKQYSYGIDLKNRFSNYFLKAYNSGQADSFSNAGVLLISAKSKDPGIYRFRPMEILAESICNRDQSQKRADWETSVRRAKSISLTVDVVGYYQYVGGPLWEPDLICGVTLPPVGLKNVDMMVSNVEYVKTIEGGTITKLHLIPPEAFIPDPMVKLNLTGDIFSKGQYQ